MEVEHIGLCFRCEYRARFHETGHGSRCECQDPTMNVSTCYMFRPTISPILVPSVPDDPRPLFGPGFICQRVRADKLPEYEDLICQVVKMGKGYFKYWRPKNAEDKRREKEDEREHQRLFKALRSHDRGRKSGHGRKRD